MLLPSDFRREGQARLSLLLWRAMEGVSSREGVTKETPNGRRLTKLLTFAVDFFSLLASKLKVP
jgi:hypothetical protein